jgi:hypothetical protein
MPTRHLGLTNIESGHHHSLRCRLVPDLRFEHGFSLVWPCPLPGWHHG